MALICQSSKKGGIYNIQKKANSYTNYEKKDKQHKVEERDGEWGFFSVKILSGLSVASLFIYKKQKKKKTNEIT